MYVIVWKETESWERIYTTAELFRRLEDVKRRGYQQGEDYIVIYEEP